MIFLDQETLQVEKETVMKSKYTSYPEGYNKVAKDIIPWFMRPVKDMLMRLLLTILVDG